MNIFAFLFLFILQDFSLVVKAVKKSSKVTLEDISDPKDFKKLLKTKNNVLAYFVQKPSSNNILSVLKDVAEKIKGSGTIVTVNCASSDGKKLCKKYKITFPISSNYILKHYKDGDFHKDYDRLETVR